MPNINTSEFNKELGRRINEARLLQGLSNQEVASKIGVTHQQFRKYTTGQDRLSLQRFLEICQALNHKPGFFFNDFESSEDIDLVTVRFMRSFNKISNSNLRRTIFDLVGGISKIKENK